MQLFLFLPDVVGAVVRAGDESLWIVAPASVKVPVEPGPRADVGRIVGTGDHLIGFSHCTLVKVNKAI